ncbi:hypothetical protein LX36DRAFT_223457 [Colletotrichum falcatum]|nr:hypothetical protein LX36DRAFT_223457 [Colletotrichum falcatum]
MHFWRKRGTPKGERPSWAQHWQTDSGQPPGGGRLRLQEQSRLRSIASAGVQPGFPARPVSYGGRRISLRQPRVASGRQYDRSRVTGAYQETAARGLRFSAPLLTLSPFPSPLCLSRGALEGFRLPPTVGGRAAMANGFAVGFSTVSVPSSKTLEGGRGKRRADRGGGSGPRPSPPVTRYVIAYKKVRLR